MANAMGSFTTPSYISFCEDETLVGGQAKAQIRSNAENTIYDLKQLLGKK